MGRKGHLVRKLKSSKTEKFVQNYKDFVQNYKDFVQNHKKFVQKILNVHSKYKKFEN